MSTRSQSRASRAEMLDTHGYHSLSELGENLDDMARLDRWLGAFDDLVRLARLHEVRTALDVGVGSGAFIAYARLFAPQVAWTALDVSRDVLTISRVCTGETARVQARAQQLPFANAAFDLVTCAHTLHHQDETGARLLLRECARVASRRIVILDLARSQLTYVGARILTRLISRNRLTRSDGPQSALNAYTAPEALALARSAGLAGATIFQPWPFRFALVFVGSGPAV